MSVAEGVLKYKRQSEELLMQSGLPYTILRPGRLTDGPYTSYDLNTLLQATAGNRQDIQIAAKDELNGETSRIALAGVHASQSQLECSAADFFLQDLISPLSASQCRKRCLC